jgi:pimeloyl-ACP methyl ester carboxylesterase
LGKSSRNDTRYWPIWRVSALGNFIAMRNGYFQIADRQAERLGAFRRLAYSEWGAPDNPRIALCVHGLTRNGRDFDALAEPLSTTHRVLAIDLAGRGESDWLRDAGGYAPATYLSDIGTLLASLGVTEVDWIGTSLGGSLGMLTAGAEGGVARGLVRRLVLNDIGPLVPASGLAPIAERVGLAPDFDDLAAAEIYQREVCAEWGELSDEAWMHLTRHSLRRRDGGGFAYHHDPAIGAALRAKGAPRDVELWPWWRRIECPVLALRGAQSNILLAATAAEMRLGGAEVIEYPGIGHAPSLMVADQIEAVTGWLGA